MRLSGGAARLVENEREGEQGLHMNKRKKKRTENEERQRGGGEKTNERRTKKYLSRKSRKTLFISPFTDKKSGIKNACRAKFRKKESKKGRKCVATSATNGKTSEEWRYEERSGLGDRDESRQSSCDSSRVVSHFVRVFRHRGPLSGAQEMARCKETITFA